MKIHSNKLASRLTRQRGLNNFNKQAVIECCVMSFRWQLSPINKEARCKEIEVALAENSLTTCAVLFHHRGFNWTGSDIMQQKNTVFIDFNNNKL